MIKMAVLVSGGNTGYQIPAGTKPDGHNLFFFLSFLWEKVK